MNRKIDIQKLTDGRYIVTFVEKQTAYDEVWWADVDSKLYLSLALATGDIQAWFDGAKAEPFNTETLLDLDPRRI